LQPVFNEVNKILEKIDRLEGRFQAFKLLGLNFCHASRGEALEKFHHYASDLIKEWSSDGSRMDMAVEQGTNGSRITPEEIRTPEERGDDQARAAQEEREYARAYINVVSSSARGLIGYLDQDDDEIREKWRQLIKENPRHFRILLTHPAYAHLRQAAEERGSGDIELEVLKTVMFLHREVGMGSDELRFYRGSPTAFLIQAGFRTLLNPYSYGKMAMDTLCLEFEKTHESGSYVGDFVKMHFHHIWAFAKEPGKEVDNKPLVVGVDSLDDILSAFGECTFIGSSRLRLTRCQVRELDYFADRVLSPHAAKDGSTAGTTPFAKYAEDHKLCYCLADYAGPFDPKVDGVQGERE